MVDNRDSSFLYRHEWFCWGPSKVSFRRSWAAGKAGLGHPVEIRKLPGENVRSWPFLYFFLPRSLLDFICQPGGNCSFFTCNIAGRNTRDKIPCRRILGAAKPLTGYYFQELDGMKGTPALASFSQPRLMAPGNTRSNSGEENTSWGVPERSTFCCTSTT